jgi:hypothetical protein
MSESSAGGKKLPEGDDRVAGNTTRISKEYPKGAYWENRIRGSLEPDGGATERIVPTKSRAD